MAKTNSTSGHNVGYVRVSTTDQNTARQLEGLELDRVFTDKASGSNTKRPQLQECLAYLRQGDTLHVHSIDRLARSLADLQNLITDLTSRRVTVRFHKEGLLFGGGQGNAMDKLLLQMLGAVAEFERSLINERAAEGRVAAKQRGVKFGRPTALTKKQIAEIREWRESGTSVADLVESFGVSRSAIYRALTA